MNTPQKQAADILMRAVPTPFVEALPEHLTPEAVRRAEEGDSQRAAIALESVAERVQRAVQDGFVYGLKGCFSVDHASPPTAKTGKLNFDAEEDDDELPE